MATEPLTLRSRGGVVITLDADIHRTAEMWRSARSGLIALAGLCAAVPAIVVPPHGLFSAGALALGGLGAYVAWSRGLWIGPMNGACGKCGAAMHFAPLGAWSDDQWVRCPSCREPWKVGEPTRR